jgi:hypothetical protein
MLPALFCFRGIQSTLLLSSSPLAIQSFLDFVLLSSADLPQWKIVYKSGKHNKYDHRITPF